ncbi:MAG: hypothetical protein WAV51_04745 [Microgenomates group bacterium]
MKKIIVFLFIATIGLALGIYFSQKKPSSTLPQKTSGPATEPGEIPITGIPISQPTYVVDQTYAFPDSIEQYRVVSTTQTATISSFLTRFFNFSSPPNTINGSKGAYSIWNESEKTLIVGGSPLEASYSVSNTPTKTLSSSTAQYEIAAFAFLSELTTLFGNATPELVSTTFLSPSNEDPVPVEDPTKATVFLANYRLSLDTHPLLSRSANIESVSVGIDADKNVLSFRSYVFPEFAKSSSPVSLMSYEEAKNNLFSGTGALIEFSYIGGDTKENVILQPSIPPTRSTIYAVQLGYFFSPVEEILTPVYLFLGKGTDSSGNLLSTTTVVSATK